MEDLLLVGIAEAPVTICHGDFRIDNLLFDDAAECPERVGVLDWQITYRGPAVTDVAYLLCQSMEVDERREEERPWSRGGTRRWRGSVGSRARCPTTRSSWHGSTTGDRRSARRCTR